MLTISNNQKKKTPVIDLEDDFFGAVLNCAVRYSMGRQSYMPSLVINFITPLLPHISGKTLAVFKQDYEWALEDEERTGRNMFGDPKIDKPGWDKFYSDVCNEIDRRHKCNNKEGERMTDALIYKQDVQKLVCQLNGCVGTKRNFNNCEKRCPDFKAIDELPTVVRTNNIIGGYRKGN